MSQSSHPTLINLPQPPSQPDTPSEMPGTPTSTTTSLSALSTTAIKDGHRGATHGPHHRGHQHNLSTNSLEAERADRISRLTGMSNVSALRGSTNPNYLAFHQQSQSQQPFNSAQQTTPTSTGFPPFGGNPAPVYFDAAGQPVAATKMSTVGSASATDSIGGRTNATETGDGSGERFDDDDDDDDETHRHEDERSMDTNEAEVDTEIEMDSASGYMRGDDGDGDAVMDDDMMATRSVGGFDMDRMSDDGSASLVGFGEGAGSTVSGPIYHRRLGPLGGSSASAMAGGWGLERSSSGLSEGQQQVRREMLLRSLERENSGLGGPAGADTPVSQSVLQERREAAMVDGVAPLDGTLNMRVAPADDDVFVDTTTRGPIPVVVQQPLQANMSAIRETQQPHSHQHQQHQAQAQAQAQARQLGAHPQGSPASSASTSAAMREVAERIIRERLGDGEGRVRNTALGSPKGNEPLGKFYFEEGK